VLFYASLCYPSGIFKKLLSRHFCSLFSRFFDHENKKEALESKFQRFALWWT